MWTSDLFERISLFEILEEIEQQNLPMNPFSDSLNSNLSVQAFYFTLIPFWEIVGDQKSIHLFYVSM